MAELDVQPKRSNPWWLWLLLALIAIAVLLFLFKGCNKTPTTVVTDSTATTTDTTKTVVASTQLDWNSVDFNAAKTSDPDVTDKDVAVSGNGKYTIYTLGENVLFATDKNTLQGTADSKLKQVAASLNRRFKGAAIGIYGSTDSTGTASHNKQLGTQRAEAVKDWLIKNGGITANILSVHSLGENKPVSTNATAAGRQQNRNVQIVAFPDSTSHK